jgi:hypothetical protein
MPPVAIIIARIAQAAPSGGAVSADPTSSQLPGAALLQTLVNWAGWGALMASLAALLVGGGMWGWSQHHGSTIGVTKGKMTALGGAAGAIVVGLAPTVINTLHSLASG